MQLLTVINFCSHKYTQRQYPVLINHKLTQGPKWGQCSTSSQKKRKRKKKLMWVKPIWLWSTFPALCFTVDIDFGPELEAAGCRWSEIPARPCEEANVVRSKTKTTIWYKEEGGEKSRELRPPAPQFMFSAFTTANCSLFYWWRCPRFVPIALLMEILDGRIVETAYDYFFCPRMRWIETKHFHDIKAAGDVCHRTE